MEECVELRMTQNHARALRGILDEQQVFLEERKTVPAGMTIGESWDRVQACRELSSDIDTELIRIAAPLPTVTVAQDVDNAVG